MLLLPEDRNEEVNIGSVPFDSSYQYTLFSIFLEPHVQVYIYWFLRITVVFLETGLGGCVMIMVWLHVG